MDRTSYWRFYGRWARHAFFESLGWSDVVASVLGLAGPLLLRFHPELQERTVNEVAWQITVAVLVAVVGARLLLAPYWMYRELEGEKSKLGDENARLQSELAAARAIGRPHRIEAMRRDIEASAERRARERRLQAIRQLVDVRDQGHALLNKLERGRPPDGARDAVQALRDKLVEIAKRISPVKALTLDSAFLVSLDGREFRNAQPGIAPRDRGELEVYLRSLLLRLERFLAEAGGD